MKDKTMITLTGIIAISGLQFYAWASELNGVVFAFTSATLGIIFGYSFKTCED